MSEIGLREAMSTLRAVRRLRPDPVYDAVLGRVLEAATWAPTGGNRQPWRVIVVRDRAAVARLGELYAERWRRFAAGYEKGMKSMPEAAAAQSRKMLDAGDYLAEHFADTPVVAVFCFNPKEMAITDAKLDRISVVGGGSVYPAVQNLLLACRAEGLGCTLTTLLCECEDEVRELLAIPEPWGTACAIPIGWPVRGGHGPIRRLPVAKMAYADRFGAAFE